MSENKFNPEDRVVWKNQIGSDWGSPKIKPYKFNPQEDNAKRATIKSFYNDSVYVQWDSEYKSPPNPVPLSDFWTQEEYDEMEKDLSDQFEKVSEQVKQNLKVAAEAIHKAQQVAAEMNLTLRECDENTELFRALQDAGWRTSALYC